MGILIVEAFWFAPSLNSLIFFNLIKEQACDALFQDIIHSFLQIRIQSEVNIISGDRIHPALRINFLPQVVHIYGFAAFFTLKVCFHNLLYPGLTHGIIPVSYTHLDVYKRQTKAVIILVRLAG